MERMESTTHDQMATWLASGGAASVESVIAMQDQDMELQAAMLTRSPQACYSIDQGVELQAAMLTRSPQTCYSIDREDKGLSAAAATHSIECRIHL
ncbi:hypothetical protein [Thalassospira alkalitolerans]|uniref:hypothetical protein n=1 Tax=Thalassospira alkalitolerans TaxID=1293890 RepID=UPI003AA852E6